MSRVRFHRLSSQFRDYRTKNETVVEAETELSQLSKQVPGTDHMVGSMYCSLDIINQGVDLMKNLVAGDPTFSKNNGASARHCLATTVFAFEKRVTKPI